MASTARRTRSTAPASATTVAASTTEPTGRDTRSTATIAVVPPVAPAATPATPVKVKPPAATPTSYRAKRAAKGAGLSDEQLVSAIREHTLQHFNDGGWDVISEAWDDAQIIEAVGWTDALPGALKKLRPIVSVYADRQADAENSQ